MLKRALFVTAAAAVFLPLAAAPAQASCLDDATSASLTEGYSISPKSPYWYTGYVQVSGTATVSLHGDAAVSDWSSFATDDMPEYTTVVASNSVSTTTTFVDCVAG